MRSTGRILAHEDVVCTRAGEQTTAEIRHGLKLTGNQHAVVPSIHGHRGSKIISAASETFGPNRPAGGRILGQEYIALSRAAHRSSAKVHWRPIHAKASTDDHVVPAIHGDRIRSFNPGSAKHFRPQRRSARGKF